MDNHLMLCPHLPPPPPHTHTHALTSPKSCALQWKPLHHEMRKAVPRTDYTAYGQSPSAQSFFL